MVTKIAIAGASGYAGGEILRLLLQHPAHLAGELEIGTLGAGSSAGESLAQALPHLPQLHDRHFDNTTAESLAGHDVVFLGLPHGHSAAIAEQLGPDVLVIDCAADFRLRDEQAWQAYYGGSYAGCWPYGIPELPGHRQALQNTKRVAVPGCFPTGATLALWPAVQAGIIEPAVNVVSITGVSGGGKKAAVSLLGAETMGSLKAYNTAGKHRHNPEIAQNLNEFSAAPVSVSFTPVLAPLPRGILTTATARLAEDITSENAYEVYAKAYQDEPFVRLLPAGIQPQTKAVVGSNMCHVQVEVDSASGTLLVTSAIDNLTKGTAGAAIQCMNLALGWEETAGLPRTGLAP